MNVFVLLIFFCLASCATKYIVPGNRFITPESQGQAFRGQIELQQSNANQITIDVRSNSVDNGVLYSDISRLGFLISHSFFEQFDAVWTHTGSGNSLLGGKFQLYGPSRTANGVGHKIAIAGLIGANEHETLDKTVEFRLAGQEFLLIYGYRFSEFVLAYGNFSHASYDFTGKITSPGSPVNGAEPRMKTRINSLSTGVEFTYSTVFSKLEATYQQLQTSQTKEKLRLALGYSIGFTW